MIPKERIIGKYKVESKNYRNIHTECYTDNVIEAVWLANKFPNKSTPVNICGDRDFIKEKGRWKSIPLP